MKILILSNGHGEDQIAVRIIEQLYTFSNPPEIVALPLVGQGYAYKKLNVPLLGSVQTMPSGGFIYQDSQQLWRDVQGGLIPLTYEQYKVIRQWGKTGHKILAVGDIVPLLFAWLSGTEYGFVGTAKSDYYLRDETGWLSHTSGLTRWLGSRYFPHERWLMSHPRCRGVFPRDSLTAQGLKRWSIPIFDLGNPMMDGLEPSQTENLTIPPGTLTILLLPGSRPPEAYNNWQLILESLAGVMGRFSDRSVVFLGAISPGLSLDSLQFFVMSHGWIYEPLNSGQIRVNDDQVLGFTKDNGTLILSQNIYRDCLQKADLAIAMAGTATEQFVGLGKPVITIPGKGPQFTPEFAIAQTHLLGNSVILVENTLEVGPIIDSIINDPQRLEEIAENGKRRLGNSGAAQRIAQCLMGQFWNL
ncbi:lipid-A-disaccharide synthase-related protein [Aphanothece sacrum]|uniref:Lipid-A-disaccharide synthase n=1 Tax=Aphanothece sacrum FPU1 TaxID=1920663 RepID=A0A401IEN5_APHSA|nr:lipid-A-disaccharide synthase-related protein [Aphanothece sacrum]GBF79733.1 lipid-A-disaccharide synthase [Aphanothece sacrum FPU1]GBF85735.1 lipid-A-disaccharide synthase [Aphanothece sacrum FPU3]